MKNKKDQTDPLAPSGQQPNPRNAAVPLDQDTIDAVHDSSVGEVGEGAADEQDGDVSVEFRDCLDLIGRVKEHSPDYLNDLSESTQPDASDGVIARRLGRFDIQGLLGQGGFGIVYKAIDSQLGRTVALKVPRMETLFREADRNRFLHEAQAMCRLSHPNLATIFEAGHEGPIYYIASQYYGGGTLAECFERGTPFSQRQSAELVKTLAEAVQHAHSRGILHRDIKPTNVIFEHPASEEDVDDSKSTTGTSPTCPDASQARLADFGLARMLDVDDRQTKTGALLGTPSYMSPEQAESRTAEIGVASDVYALGAILYEMLTGRPPHQADSLVATLDAVRKETPTVPRKLDPNISLDLEAICLKCLQKDQSLRYPTSQALADDLGRWLEGHSVEARHPTTVERLQRWCRLNPAWSLLAATVAIALISTAVISSLAYMRVKDANLALTASNTALKEAQEQEARRTSQLRDSLDAQVSVVLQDFLLRSFKLTDAHRKYLTDTLAAYEAFTKDQGNERRDRIANARAFVRVGEIRHRLGESAEAIKAYESAIERFQQLISEDDSNPQLAYDRSKAKGSLGNIYKQRQELDEARRLLQEALSESKSLIAQDPRDLDFVRLSINQQASLANLERATGKPSEAMSFLQEALQQATEQLDYDLPDDEFLIAKLRGSMAQFLFAERDFATIETLLDQAIATDKRLLERYRDNPEYMVNMADNLNMLGYLYLSTGRMELAKLTLSELMQLRRELANRFPANTLYQSDYVLALTNFGSVLMQNDEAEPAEELWMEGYEAAQRLVSLDPGIPNSRALLAALAFSLAQIRLDQDNLEAAETLAEQGKLELQSVLESKVADPYFMQVVGERHVVFARLYSALGRHEDAIEQTAYLQEHPFHPIQSPILIARTHAKAAMAANESGDTARADELKLKAREELRLAAKRGFNQWDSLEKYPALMQLFSQEDFAAIRSPE